ncbi:MAG TPA: 1-acyl-sn-glycerol-3-phosphate acyltransferase [Polyangiaceae bacterium]|nr:1-acyl-sn-glycerol-3-phosphate acyltransferase [Polyangiaceae bacterium]
MVSQADSKRVRARLARAALAALGGWRYVGEVPAVKQGVCLAFPHTDNMDGVLLLLLAQSVGLPISWMVKDSWGRGVLGPLVRGAGGVLIDRSKANGMVGQMVEAFARADELFLFIPPEGTRGYTDYWKSGFYRIAIGANVPVMPGFLDYSTKTGGVGPPLAMTGDVRADMDRIRAHYGPNAAAMAKDPRKVGPIRLREEEAKAP